MLLEQGLAAEATPSQVSHRFRVQPRRCPGEPERAQHRWLFELASAHPGNAPSDALGQAAGGQVAEPSADQRRLGVHEQRGLDPVRLGQDTLEQGVRRGEVGSGRERLSQLDGQLDPLMGVLGKRDCLAH